MQHVIARLSELQRAIAGGDFPTLLDQEVSKLYFAEIQGLLHVEYYGPHWNEPGEPFDCLIDLLCDAGAAAGIRSLTFRGPDEGANGTRNWDFTGLLASDVIFPNLTTFCVEPTQPEHHNQTILAEVYEEEGMIGRLLDRMPALESLTVPSAPDCSFFTRPRHPLRRLRVDTGYDHQDFIRNLSASSCFPHLELLDFGDYNQRYMEDYMDRCTRFEDYRELARSRGFESVRLFILRNASLSAEQWSELGLAAVRAIQCHGNYVHA